MLSKGIFFSFIMLICSVASADAISIEELPLSSKGFRLTCYQGSSWSPTQRGMVKPDEVNRFSIRRIVAGSSVTYEIYVDGAINSSCTHIVLE